MVSLEIYLLLCLYLISPAEYAYQRRRSSNRSAGLIRAREEPSSEEVIYVQRNQSSQDPNPTPSYSTAYYDPNERGRSTSRSTGSRSRRSSTYYEKDRDLAYTYKHYHSSSLQKPLDPQPASYPPSNSTSEDQYQDQELSFQQQVEEEERISKKLRNKELLAAAFATITSVAAVTSIYQSLEDQQKRRKLLRCGEMTREEARKQKNKAILYDLVNVGSAAVGVNSAVNGWKRMQAQKAETQKAHDEFEEKRRQRDMYEAGVEEGYYWPPEGKGREYEERYVR